MDFFPSLARLVVNLICFLLKQSMFMYIYVFCDSTAKAQSCSERRARNLVSANKISPLSMTFLQPTLNVLNFDRGCNISVHSLSTLIS